MFPRGAPILASMTEDTAIETIARIVDVDLQSAATPTLRSLVKVLGTLMEQTEARGWVQAYAAASEAYESVAAELVGRYV